MSATTRIPEPDPAAAAARAALAEAESAGFDPAAPDRAAAAYARAAGLLQPAGALPDDRGALELLRRALEGLAVERAGLGEPGPAREARHRAAVAALLADDPLARARNLEIAADLGELAGDVAGAAADLRAAAAAFAARGLAERAAGCAGRAGALDPAGAGATSPAAAVRPAPGDAAPPPDEPPAVDPAGPDPDAGDRAGPDPGAAADPEPGWPGRLALAKRLLREGDPVAAQRICEQAIEADGRRGGPDPVQLGDAHLGLVAARMRAGLDIREAAIDAANALPHLGPARLRARLSVELARLLAPEQAAWRVRRQLLAAAAEDSAAEGDRAGSVRARLRLAAEKAAAGELAAAHDDFDDLVTEAYRLRDLELYAEAVLHLGRSWARAGRLPEAIAQFDRVLANFALEAIDSPAERLRVGRLLLEKARALAVLDPAATGPGSAAALARRARALFREQEEPALVAEADRVLDEL